MPSSAAILKITLLTSVLIAHGPARAGENGGAAVPTTLAQAATDELLAYADANSPPARQDTSPEIGLVTGDGQQGAVDNRLAVCGERDAECNP